MDFYVENFNVTPVFVIAYVNETKNLEEKSTKIKDSDILKFASNVILNTENIIYFFKHLNETFQRLFSTLFTFVIYLSGYNVNSAEMSSPKPRLRRSVSHNKVQEITNDVQKEKARPHGKV